MSAYATLGTMVENGVGRSRYHQVASKVLHVINFVTDKGYHLKNIDRDAIAKGANSGTFLLEKKRKNKEVPKPRSKRRAYRGASEPEEKKREQRDEVPFPLKWNHLLEAPTYEYGKAQTTSVGRESGIPI